MASKKSSTSRAKPPKGRPTSTSAISHPSNSTLPSILSSFSPDASLFAFVVLAVDKHRLRVYDTATGRAICEYTIDSARVTALKWHSVLSDFSSQEQQSPNKKRKKTSATPTTSIEKETASVIVLGLSDGTVLFFSPSSSKVTQTLVHPTITSAILSLSFDSNKKSALWTSSADSTVCLWDTKKSTILVSWKNDDHIPCTSLLSRSDAEGGTIDLLAAHHSIRFFADIPSEGSSLTKPKQSSGFTGHASSVKSLLWSKQSQDATKFFSMAENDRFVYCWNVEGASNSERPIATTSLDSDVRTIALATTNDSQQCLIALSTLGKISFIPIPLEFPVSLDKSKKLNTLLPRSTVSSVSKSDPSGPPVVDLAPLPGQEGSVRVVRLVKGVQPAFDTIRYLEDNGSYVSSPTLPEIKEQVLNQGSELPSNKRYVEPKSLAVGSGYDGDNAENSTVDVEQELDGSLQVDLAEMSLGQRLTALTDPDANPISESDDDEDPTETPRRTKSTKKSRGDVAAIQTNSLTRTLIQALHSSDSRLLEMCLAHSDSGLIQNTVRRLPPQLAVPLISACVERLGRGPRSANMKGGGGGASSQRGLGLLVWLRAVLTVHTGHLMTIPDLVARLSGLHATLNARLSLHESLLSLNGRLDMVLSQVELRASTAPASLAPSKADKRKPDALVKRYVEGETDSSDDQDDDKMDVEIEEGSDEEGSIEDVELGGDSEDEEDEDESSDSDGGGFIDDEAEEEEYTGDEDEDESE